MLRTPCVVVSTLLVAAGCVDEPAFYGSPCGRFASSLLCDRESGGADPTSPTTDPEPTATCDSVCAQLAGCGLFDPDEVPACVAGCSQEGWPVACIYEAGCDIDSAEACFGDTP